MLGGALFQTVDGRSTYHRAIAYGLWVAASLLLVAMPVAGSKRLYKHTDLSPPEGWTFLAAAVVLTVAGALLDAALT